MSEREDDLPTVISEGVWRVTDGVVIRCYNLSNGERVFDADDVAAVFGFLFEPPAFSASD